MESWPSVGRMGRYPFSGTTEGVDFQLQLIRSLVRRSGMRRVFFVIASLPFPWSAHPAAIGVKALPRIYERSGAVAKGRVPDAIPETGTADPTRIGLTGFIGESLM